MGYAGTSAPVNPGTLKAGATADETTAFNDLATKYNTDQPKYQADQAVYDKYKTDYQNRVQNTPMYVQSQFQTKQPSSIDDMYKHYQGRDPDVAGKAYWQAEFGNGPLTQAQKNTWLKAAEVSEAQNPNPNPHSQDLYNRTGSYWGNQLAMPTYGQGSNTTGFTPIAAAPVPVTPIPVTPVVPTPIVNSVSAPQGGSASGNNSVNGSGSGTPAGVGTYGGQGDGNGYDGTGGNIYGIGSFDTAAAASAFSKMSLLGMAPAAIAAIYAGWNSMTPAQIAAEVASLDSALATKDAANHTSTTNPGMGGGGYDSAGVATGNLGNSDGGWGNGSGGWGTGPGSGGGGGGGGGGSQSSGGGNSNRGESGASSSRGFKFGGLVRKYADGGQVQDTFDPPSAGANVEGNMGLDVSRLTPAQARFLAQQDPQAMARGVDRFNQTHPAAPQPQETLPQMAQAYNTPEMQLYTQEYQQARRQAAEDRANFEKLLQASLNRKDEVGPSKAEMYFNLAAAFGSPTRTGSFGESLANASTVMAGQKKGEREAALAARDRKDKLALDIAQYRAAGSKDDLTNLRTLTVEEMKALRLAGMPVSEVGKTIYDEGLRPGVPGYAERVTELAKRVQANKEPAPHFLQGANGITMSVNRSGDTHVVTGPDGNPVIAPDYQESPYATPSPVLGVPVPSVLPWASQSNPKDANKVKSAEQARGAKEVEADADAAKKSLNTAQEAARFQLLNQRVETGGISDKFKVGQMVQGLGSDYSDMLGITSRLTPSVRPVGSGSTSDADMALFKAGTVGVDKPKQTNDNIANGLQLQAQRDQDYADFRATYLEQNGTLQGANKHWKEYANAYPIFDPKSPEVPAINKSHMDWKTYFKGGPQSSAVSPHPDLAGAAAAELARRKGGK
jgi:hypothetical protein